ncbi:MAG: hypothetical protein KJ625_08005, partial [Actinobacteria bacterium]|nr:hypothetical protein [Actinomycetota bacterium]
MERKGNWIWGLKRLFIVAALCFSIFCVFCSGIASKYDVSAYYVAKAMMRQGTLSLIRYFTLAYDPVSAKVATAGPGDEAVDVGNKDCLRIEDYFEALRLHGQCGIRIIKIDNEKIIKSSFTFSYQPYDEPILHEVRTKFMLNEVVAPAGNEFEKLILLRNWTRSQFKRSDYQPVTQDFNALEILTNKVRNLEG